MLGQSAEGALLPLLLLLVPSERASEKFSSGERSRGAQEERKGKVT
jgi:hypothetical protein